MLSSFKYGSGLGKKRLRNRKIQQERTAGAVTMLLRPEANIASLNRRRARVKLLENE
jgi:hypothetical protein